MEATRDAEVSDMEIEEKCRSQPPFGRSCARESTATVTALSAPRSRFFSSERRGYRSLRLSEAKTRLLRALSLVPLAVRCRVQLLPKEARERRLAPESSTLASFACVSACIFAESCSTLSHMEKLCKHRKFDATVPLTFVEFFASGC
ncbi:unnamed protein product [Coccothraustes coccothraustes]